MIIASLSRRAVLASVVSVAAIAFIASAGMRPASAATPPASAPRLATPFHLRLEKSEPASGESLASPPKSIRLFFSLPPEMAVTAVKLSDADGNAVALAAPTRGAGAKDPVESVIQGKVAAGSYTVSWKTSSKDGHPIKGDFSFSVKSAAN